ncbi:MAG: hypothetical protein IPK80_04095 [Nannocystis sp.]|nr:hypothetical protein [Nannocystis sp.]
MKFLGHSTKQIGADESPPLLVAVEYQPLRGEPERLETNVGTDAGPQRWRWRDYLFTIEAYAYDAWMELSAGAAGSAVGRFIAPVRLRWRRRDRPRPVPSPVSAPAGAGRGGSDGGAVSEGRWPRPS